MHNHLVVSAKEATIRFAVDDDAVFLTSQAYVAEDIVRRKIEHQEFIVALSGVEPVGFLQLEFLWSKVPYIALIRVLPEYRRSGVARRMLSFLETFLRERGHKTLYSSSQADEPKPQEWHRHVGFEDCGAIRGINDGIDEIFFCKSLLED
jgi:GNAT superfamily N-acetyltransferase